MGRFSNKSHREQFDFGGEKWVLTVAGVGPLEGRCESFQAKRQAYSQLDRGRNLQVSFLSFSAFRFRKIGFWKWSESRRCFVGTSFCISIQAKGFFSLIEMWISVVWFNPTHCWYSLIIKIIDDQLCLMTLVRFGNLTRSIIILLPAPLVKRKASQFFDEFTLAFGAAETKTPKEMDTKGPRKGTKR